MVKNLPNRFSSEGRLFVTGEDLLSDVSISVRKGITYRLTNYQVNTKTCIDGLKYDFLSTKNIEKFGAQLFKELLISVMIKAKL
jgi:hypothetical protein